MQFLELSPTNAAHVTSSSLFQRSNFHSYECDGFSNEVFVFSSNVGCHCYYPAHVPSHDSPPFFLPLASVALLTDASETGWEKLPVVLWLGAIDTFHTVILPQWRLVGHRESLLVTGLCSDVKEKLASVSLGTMIIVAPLRISDLSCAPCRVVACVPQCDGTFPAALLTDATHVVAEGIPFYPGGQPLLRCPFASLGMEGRKDEDRAKVIVCGCDLGTHVDSPSHFFPTGRRITNLTLKELVLVPLVVIHCEEQCRQNPDYAMTREDMQRWEERHQREIPNGALICMRSGWCEKFRDRDAYMNADGDLTKGGKMHFPSFSLDAAKFAVERNCVGLGVDTLSLDVGISEDFPVHQYVLGFDRYQVENMLLPADTNGGECTLAVVLPFSAENAFESFARVFLL